MTYEQGVRLKVAYKRHGLEYDLYQDSDDVRRWYLMPAHYESAETVKAVIELIKEEGGTQYE